MSRVLFCFQIPSREIDKNEQRFWTYWNKDTKQVGTYYLYRKDLIKRPGASLI